MPIYSSVMGSPRNVAGTASLCSLRCPSVTTCTASTYPTPLPSAKPMVCTRLKLWMVLMNSVPRIQVLNVAMGSTATISRAPCRRKNTTTTSSTIKNATVLHSTITSGRIYMRYGY